MLIKLEKIFRCNNFFRFQKNFEFCPALNDKNGLIDMILMSDSATFGTDISNVSPKNYKETSELDGDVYNWKRRGYSLILDILMVMIKHNVYKLKHLDNI